MSEVAGRMSIQVGAHCLEKEQGGCGILLGGVAGVAPGKIVILGGGVSGTHAARMAMGIEASVTVIDKSLRRLRELNTQYGARLQTLFATVQIIEREVSAADLVIGAVLVPGAAAPKLVRRETVRQMKRGAAIVDISIDQGGCFETSRPTTHAAPTYETEGVIHYCVTNMPGAVAAQCLRWAHHPSRGCQCARLTCKRASVSLTAPATRNHRPAKLAPEFLRSRRI